MTAFFGTGVVLRALAFVGGSLATLALSAGCSNQAGAGAGTQCFTAVDCAPGLACVPKVPNGTVLVCSTNLTAIETQIDAGMDVAPGVDAGPFVFSDGAPPSADATGHDATKPVDSGHPVDAGSGSKDTGSSAQDAGHDAGSAATDAGRAG